MMLLIFLIGIRLQMPAVFWVIYGIVFCVRIWELLSDD